MIVPTVALSDVAKIERSTITADRIADGETYVGLENVTNTGELVGISAVKAGALRSSKFKFDSGHVLYGKLRPYLAKIAAPMFSGVCSTDILPIRPGPTLDRIYLYHYLRTPAMVAHASKLAVGINLPRLSPTSLSGFPVPLLPLKEQRRIADVLEAADGLQSRRRAARTRLGSLTQAVFIGMFGDPVSNPKGWPVADLSSLGELDRGVSRHRPRNDPMLLGGQWPLVQTGDVANSGGYITRFKSTYSNLGRAQSKLWPAGTLCITIAANIARTGILDFDACFPDSVVGFSASDSGTVEYVRVFLNFMQPTLEQQAPESAQKNINLKVLRSLTTPVPPVEARAQFGQAMTALRNLDGAQQESWEGLNALFRSLQDRAFRGEL